jgi:hypothetical protein
MRSGGCAQSQPAINAKLEAKKLIWWQVPFAYDITEGNVQVDGGRSLITCYYPYLPVPSSEFGQFAGLKWAARKVSQSGNNGLNCSLWLLLLAKNSDADKV